MILVALDKDSSAFSADHAEVKRGLGVYAEILRGAGRIAEAEEVEARLEPRTTRSAISATSTNPAALAD